MLSVITKDITIPFSVLSAIHNDERIAKSKLVIDEYRTLYCANNGNVPITDAHQIYAKGLIYERFVDAEAGLVDLTWVSVPFIKFYNSFEQTAISDLNNLQYDRTEVVKKQDGTLISRWQYRGKVYFSTRGNILTPNKLFYKPVMDIVTAKYPKLLEFHPGYDNSTILMEYVGPSNTIIEVYEEDDLIAIGQSFSYRGEINYKADLSLITENFGVPTTKSFGNSNPKEILNSLQGVQEGVIVNYIDKQDRIVYKVKMKQEEYLRLLKAKYLLSLIDDEITLLIDHNGNIQTILDEIAAKVGTHAYLEELLFILNEHLTSKKVMERYQEIVETKASLEIEVARIRQDVNKGVHRKEIYESATKVNLKGKNWSGVIMSMLYKDTDERAILKSIKKVLG